MSSVRLRPLLRHLWALPVTALGLPFIPIACISGEARIVSGVLELHGRWIAMILRRVPIVGGASAMTLGHIVIAIDQKSLDRTRCHERVHVRQAERWGILFVPAYLLASVIAQLRGRDAYLDNPFEKEAFTNDR